MRTAAQLTCIGLLVVMCVSGCQLDPYETGREGRWNFPDAAWEDAEIDSGPDACEPTDELCDGLDNDCDGDTDEGFDLQTDPHNCGSCGYVCQNHVGAHSRADGCVDAVCQYVCEPNFHDLDGDVADGENGNGCEYNCAITNNGVETCDQIDNDCNGLADENFDLQNDPNNCGQCHRTCVFFQGEGACQNGQCELARCYSGYVDKDADPNNGCECLIDAPENMAGTTCDATDPGGCPVSEVCVDRNLDQVYHCSAVPADDCDGIDNDCDNQTDEDAPIGSECYTPPTGCTFDGVNWTCLGECHTGFMGCVGGVIQCTQLQSPAGEICDDLDNDCNGTTDDGFDKQNDPANCGGCGVTCATLVPNAVSGCSGGQCTVVACLPGYWDINTDPSDGCEYACTLSNGGVEGCGDNVDNDCDALTDEGFDYQNDPSNCGGCGNDCEVNKPFGTSTNGCSGGVCQYQCLPDHYDLNGDLSAGPAGNGCEYACTASGAELCDGIDNDCNGQTDETFDTSTDINNCGACGYVCSAHVGANSTATGCSGGVCQFACTGNNHDLNGDVGLGDQGDGCEYGCTITGAEDCDGQDDDCDGQTDEDAGGNPLTQACYTGPVGTENVGPCRGGSQTCSGGGWGGCQGEVTPGVESCDGVDNDCDADTDEDAGGAPLTQACYTGPPATENVGLCHGGTQNCNAGIWGICQGEVTPVAELCDLADNDCDTQTDEDFDTQTDMLNCGNCGWSCVAHVGANSFATACSGGSCQYACLPNYYDLNGNVNLGDTADGCEYSCTITNNGVEACGDSVDNDCDGQTDEGFNFNIDPDNCGSCGYVCAANAPYGTTATGCSGGSCQFACLPNYWDNDGDLGLGEAGNGCEYACTPSGAEVCDNQDNDCDGLVDEDTDKQTDVNHCGSCGYVCAANMGANSTVTGCSGGVCQFACLANFHDLNGDVALGSGGDGCEYPCTITGVEDCDGQDDDCDGQTDEDAGGNPLTQACYTGPGGTENVGPCHGGTRTCSGGGWGACNGEVTPQPEFCDNIDNDCDSQTDENAAGNPLNQVCYTGPPATRGVGECQDGNQTCTAGAWGACNGEVTPQTETCDTLDNDCDNQADEDFDTQTDILNCGSCGYSCVVNAGANSFATGCAGGNCQYSCQPNYYDINGDIALGSGGNGCEYNCTLTNGGVEACGDLIDNDCDGQTDEGFDLNNDINNCGSCGYACGSHTPFGATATGCSAGVCQFVCQANYWDIDLDLALGEAGTGCEYNCTPSGPEICDDLDNNCDGQVDEGFFKDTNPLNCGSCGYRCVDYLGPNSSVLGCAGGVCQYTCVAGWVDLNGDVNQGNLGDGCEYNCTVSGAEDCDGNDDDCDGLTDEDAGGSPLTQPCYTGPGGTQGVGLCQGGTETCTGGGWGACQGEVTPQSELCDNLDNDCDNQTDEDFNLNTDLNNCGACGNSCWAVVPNNAYPSACAGGNCQYSCLVGFADLNGDINNPAGDGCEYTCPVSPPVGEYCDGEDNDCDGGTDEGLTPPVGLCNQGTDGPGPPPAPDPTNNPCKNTTALCQDPDGGGPLPHGWYCQYPASVETDPANPNLLLGYENLCNGWDGDCDGNPDDGFGLGNVCDNGQFGQCRVTGTIICDSGDPTQTLCDLPPPATWPTPTDEVCDGVDNDCDNLADENPWENDPANDPPAVLGWVIDDVVTVTTPSGVDVFVYTYEASRPSATAGDAGVGTSVRACSRQGVIPWSNVTYAQAQRACARAGARLCTAEEWYEGCNGTPGDFLYPYGAGYQATWCNGFDSDGTPDVEPTGTQLSCDSIVWGAEDMSGNLREWTNDQIGWSCDGLGIYRIRGGSYIDLEGGLTCLFDKSAYVEDALASHVGFRCCSTCGNGTIDPGETCDPAPPANSPNCNPVFCGPDTCGDGVLDAGEQCDDGNLLPLDACSPQCQDTWVTLMMETFCNCLPAGWTINDGGSDGNTWECCPGGTCTEQTGNSTGSGSGGMFMKADSDEDGNGPWMREGLVTPVFDLSGYTAVRLSFWHHYDDLGGSDYARVEYSTNGAGGPWTTIVTYTSDQVGLFVQLDVSAQVAGQSNVALRFYYDDDVSWAWYWKIDDVRLEAY